MLAGPGALNRKRLHFSSEALAQYPASFNRLYLNMVKAGEQAGALETSLKRLADFMEKSARILGRVKAGLFYPAAVMTVALGVMAVMLLVIVPRFKDVFADLGNGRPLPWFTRFVLGISDAVTHHFPPRRHRGRWELCLVPACPAHPGGTADF